MVRAALIVGPHEVEVRELERPTLPAGWGWLRIEACGLCGTDVEQYEGSFTGSSWPPGPIVPGHEVVDVDQTPLPDAVADLTAGRGVDLVVDTSAGAVGPVADAVDCVTDGGTVILAGLKAGRTATLDVDRVVLRAIRLVGVRSASWASYEMALDQLARDQRLSELRTHVYPLDRAGDAVRSLAGADPDRVYVSVVP